jgi:hypothetical protein
MGVGLATVKVADPLASIPPMETWTRCEPNVARSAGTTTVRVVPLALTVAPASDTPSNSTTAVPSKPSPATTIIVDSPVEIVGGDTDKTSAAYTGVKGTTASINAKSIEREMIRLRAGFIHSPN